MSWQATAWAARQAAGNTGRKCVLLVLANEANKNGYCWPGRATIAADCECRVETISGHLAALEEAGLIARFQRRRVNGSRTSDWIVLAPNAEDRGEMTDADTDEVPGYIAEVAATRKGAESSGEDPPSRDSQDRQVGIPGSPEPSKEPSTPSVLRVDAQASMKVNGGKQIKVGGKPVDREAWALTERILDEFNAQAGRKLGLLTGSGEPSEAATRIYSRVLAWPNLSFDRHREIIRCTLIEKWWDGPTQIGHFYGPRIFETNMGREGKRPNRGSRGQPTTGDLLRKLKETKENRGD